MPATPSPLNTSFGRGAILFDRFDSNGVRHGQFQHLGDCDNFEIGGTPDIATLEDYTQQAAGDYAAAVKKTEVTIKISGFELNMKILAAIMMGANSTYTQTAATVTSETLAAATITGLLGSYFKLLGRNISSATLLMGTTTLVSGTDWDLFNANAGVVHLNPNGVTVTDGSVIAANYVQPVLTGANALTTVQAFNQGGVSGQLLFVPNNTVGPNIEARVWNVYLTPSGPIPFISDDFIKWTVDGKCLVDTQGTYGGSAAEPFMRLTKQTAGA